MAALEGRAWLLAPNQRGYGPSSIPEGVAAYRAKLLTADLVELIEQTGGPLDLLVAHDWGGAVAWNLAAQRPELMRKLLIVNAPHPAVFLKALRDDPAQQAASAYMNALCEPDAAARLAADDFKAMWAFFEAMSPGAGAPGGWLNEATRDQYRNIWCQGLEGPLNWYRASPLKPPRSPKDAVMTLNLPDAAVTVRVPTLVLWGEGDRALPPSLLDGLGAWVPNLVIERVPEASHWIVHEQPERVIAAIQAALRAR
jgi:epoxide hydrolase 4